MSMVVQRYLYFYLYLGSEGWEGWDWMGLDWMGWDGVGWDVLKVLILFLEKNRLEA